MKYIKKHWFIITIILLCLIRFLISFNLINFYIGNLPFDDALMLRQSSSLLSGDYLGLYSNMTLVKGPIFPFLIAFLRLINLSYSFSFTILYILSTLFFVLSLKKIIKDKRILLIIFAFLLFNPVTYSSELFQRLYRNVLSIPELLFFLGCVINVLFSDKHKILNNISLGLITSIMLLTREDTIWTYIVLIFIYGYKIIQYIKDKKKINIVNVLISLFPIFVIIINLNVISYINYKHYNIYTYNELNDTSFKSAYKKVLEIKDDEKIDKVDIPRTTFEKLTKNSKLLKITEEELEEFYNQFQNEDGEIDNGNGVWYFRNLVNRHNKFKDGEEAKKFYNKLSLEIDYFFETGVFEKEMVLPSTYLYMPTENEIIEIPKSIIKSIIYTSTYDQVKTLTKRNIESYDNQKYDDKINSYTLSYKDYRNSANIPKNNPIIIEIIRIIYKYFTIIFSFVAVFIYLKNIKKFDNLNIIIDIILISYLVIIFGISYNNATAFPSIRYSYLANIYILQNLFILLNLYRLYSNRGNNMISVVIPCYNEEKSIGSTIDEIIKVMKDNNIYKGSEIIVVNDGSSDNTGKILEKKKVKVITNPCNMGYGYSLKKGINEAINETIVITDADSTYPFSCVIDMLKEKEKGFDLVVGRRCGKYYKESFHKSMLRKILKKFVEFVSGKKVKDVNSGLRVFDKSTVVKYFPRLCNTFSFTTSQTLAYLMNSLTVSYVDIPYNKRKGKSKVRLFKDSMRSLKYILESSIYYNPLKIFSLLSVLCLILSAIGFVFSHFLDIHAGYILGIAGLLLSIVEFSLGILAVLLKQIMDK